MSTAEPASWRKPVLAMIAAALAVHIAFAGGRVALSLFAIHLHASPLMVGAMVSLLAVLPMLFSVRLGRWTDRVGILPPARIAGGMAALACLLPWLAPQIGVLCLAAMLLGSAFMLLHIATNNAMGRVATDSTRTQVLAWVAMGFSVSGVAGPIIAGFAIDHFGHAWAFFVLATLPALLFCAAMAMPAHRDPAPPRWVEHPAGSRPHVVELLKLAPLRAVFIASACMSVAWDVFIFMTPVYGASVRLSAAEVGLVMGAFGVATFVTRLALPWIDRRFSEWQILAGALAAGGLGYAAAPLLHQLPGLMALAFFVGLGLGGAQPTVLSLLHQTAPNGRQGEAIGVRTSLLNASQVFMPLVLGALASGAGMAAAFWAMGLVCAGGAWFAWRRHPRR